MPYFLKYQYQGEPHEPTGLSLESTVQQLLNEIYRISFNNNPRKLVLMYNDEELDDHSKTLEEYDMNENRNMVLVGIGNPGGSSSSSSFPSKVKTKKATCVGYFMEYDKCAQLECGCYMSHPGVLTFIKDSDDKEQLLKCTGCKKVLKLDKVLYLANYEDDDEYDRLYEKFSKRYRKFNKKENKSQLTVCPGCKALNKRPTSLRKYRVKCGGCSLDYCYQCEEKWKKTTSVLCGNTECETWDNQLQLRRCKPLKDDKGRSWVKQYNTKWATNEDEKIPCLRACPGCWRILTVVANCNHITCEGCKHQFCYICLKNWSGHNSTTCYNTKPAPRQTFS